mmetsp:Transcript_1197/g.1994  ORF Transcript_1197/g.1994 Transcript_1197/m.1994 type:complete len:82 (-) Transcript_1197:2-247(-)
MTPSAKRDIKTCARQDNSTAESYHRQTLCCGSLCGRMQNAAQKQCHINCESTTDCGNNLGPWPPNSDLLQNWHRKLCKRNK